MPQRSYQQIQRDNASEISAMKDVQDWIQQLRCHGVALAVDDKQEDLDRMSSLLRDLNFQTDTATSGDRALELTHRNNYDLTTVDINMAPMDGITLIKEIKKIKPDAHLLIVTAHAEDASLAPGIQDLGAIAVIEKPVAPRDLRVPKITKFIRPKAP